MDDVARAVGAEGADEGVSINGKRCRVRPLSIKELTEVQREGLRLYKQQYLQTWADATANMANGEVIYLQKVEEAARWDVNNLPAKFVCDPANIQVTDKLIMWLTENMGLSTAPINGKPQPVNVMEMIVRRLAATAIDSETLDPNLYETLVGSPIRRLKVGYINWWLTGTYDGMLTLIWCCFKADGVTKDEVAEEIGRNPTLLAHLSREIEHLSVPAVGNG